MKILIVTKNLRDHPSRENVVSQVCELVRQAGHEPFLAYLEIGRQGLVDAREFMPFVRNHIRKSSLMIVLYEPELRGGLIEMGVAYAFEVPIWLFYRLGERLPSSALGCARQVIPYTSLQDLSSQLSLALHELKP
jgi:hypothetical protein